jgi:dolichol kinase
MTTGGPMNPYAPPAADTALPGVTPPGLLRGPMFSAMQIGWAAFFGVVLGGVLLLQVNLRRTGRHAAANAAVSLGLLASVGLLALLLFFPPEVTLPARLIAAWGLYKVAGSLQGDAYFKHTIAGGARYSNWVVFAVILVTFGVAAAALIALRSALYRSLLHHGLSFW